MKSKFVTGLVAGIACSSAGAKELPPDDVKGAELYETGIMMDRVMSLKLV